MHRPTFLMLAIAALGDAATASGDLLVVLDKSEHRAVLVDPETLEPVETLPTGMGPHEVVVSPDGRRAWVCNYGAFGIFRDDGERRNEPGNTLTVIDLVERRVAGVVDLGSWSMPHGIRASRDGRTLWVTVEGSQAVLELDAASGAVRHAWPTGQEVSHMLVETPDERKLYVSNIRSGSVSVITRAAGSVVTIPTGAGAEGIAATPDGREVWVTNRGANTISVISTGDDRVVESFGAGGEMPIRVQFTPDGREAWVSLARSDAVGVYDARTRAPIATIEVGAMPVGIQMSPDGRRAFVACTNADVIKAIDVAARRVVADLVTGREPDGMAWARVPAGGGRRRSP